MRAHALKGETHCDHCEQQFAPRVNSEAFAADNCLKTCRYHARPVREIVAWFNEKLKEEEVIERMDLAHSLYDQALEEALWSIHDEITRVHEIKALLALRNEFVAYYA